LVYFEMCRRKRGFRTPEQQVRKSCHGFSAAMQKIRITEEVVRRIEDALDERKGERRGNRGDGPSAERRNACRRKPPDAETEHDGVDQSTPPDS
jgi:hypothetical protein